MEDDKGEPEGNEKEGKETEEEERVIAKIWEKNNPGNCWKTASERLKGGWGASLVG